MVLIFNTNETDDVEKFRDMVLERDEGVKPTTDVEELEVKGLDLSGLVVIGYRLETRDKDYYHFDKITFSGCLMDGVVFENLEGTEIVIENSEGEGIVINNSFIQYMEMYSSVLPKMYFEDSILYGVDYDECIGTKTTFKNSFIWDFTVLKSSFRNTTFDNTEVDSTFVLMTDMSNLNTIKSKFKDFKMKMNVDVRRSEFMKTDFYDVSIREKVSFEESIFKDVNVFKPAIEETSFKGVTFYNVVFRGDAKKKNSYYLIKSSLEGSIITRTYFKQMYVAEILMPSVTYPIELVDEETYELKEESFFKQCQTDNIKKGYNPRYKDTKEQLYRIK